MPDLDLQIYSYFEATTRPIGVDELLNEQPPVTVATPGRRSSIRGGLLVAVAVVIVAVITVAVVFLVPGSDTPPVAPPTPSITTTTIQPEPTTLPSSTTLPLDEEGSGSFDPNAWIAVFRNIENGGTVLVHPDGTGRIPVPPPDGGIGMMPDWSPDGTRLVLSRRGLTPDYLYEFDIDTGRSRQLFASCAEPCVDDFAPSYSPDGTRVAFIRLTGRSVTVAGEGHFEDTECSIRIGDTTSETVDKVLTVGCDASAPRWSPDGDKLVYSALEEATSLPGATTSREAVFIVDLASGEVSQITDFDIDGGEPDWSPDGEWIVFGTHALHWYGDGPGGDLYRVRPDGSDLEKLTSEGRAGDPRYTPDGHWIVYTFENRQIWALPSAGGQPVPLLTDRVYGQADWQP